MNGNGWMKNFINKYLGKIVGSYFLIMITFIIIFIFWMFNLFERGIMYYDGIFFLGGFLIDLITMYYVCKRDFKDTFIVVGISFMFFLINIFFKFYKYIGF